MFRRLATRLTAAYVFAAIVLVVIVVAAVTAFALSMFGIAARESSEAVALQAPEEVRLEVGRSSNLAAAAPDIARHLARAGLRILVFGGTGPHREFLAAAGEDFGGGRTSRTTRPPLPVDRAQQERTASGAPPDAPPAGTPPDARAPDGRPPDTGPPFEHRPFDAGWPPQTHMAPFPFGLNAFLHLGPVRVAVPGGMIAILPDPAPLARTINAFWLAMLPIGVFVILAAWVLGRTIAGQALRPLVETTASLRRFGDGDFTPRPVVTAARNEFGELVEAYNAAAAQVSAAFEERRAAEEQMRQFIADAGHELRTPLTVIMGFIDVLRRRAQHDASASTRIYDAMLAESRRMKALIERLIVLARMENPSAREHELVDLADVARQVVVAQSAVGLQERVTLEARPGLFVVGDQRELHDAIANLVENALKYAPESPVRVRAFEDGGDVLLDVTDRGPGIPAPEQQQVFARFYRGRDRVDAEGFGLGLSIAKRAVERAGGRITLDSAAGSGSRFTIRIPRAPRGEATALAV